MTFKPYFRALLLTSLLVAGASSAQIKPKKAGPLKEAPSTRVPPRPVAMPCPDARRPDVMTVSQMNPTSPDFAPLPPNTRLGSGLNDTTQNQFFRHTFVLRSPKKCCQIMSAVLTIRVVSNGPVGPRTGSTAGNDSWSVTGNGSTIPGNGEGYIYPGPSGANTARTITVNLNAAALAHMNSTNRLSFQLQDDTRVVGASLSINRCCLTI